MNEIVDRIFLLICCLAFYLFHMNINMAVIPTILVIILSSLFIFFDNKRYCLAGNLIFALLCCYIPGYIIFLPILLYDVLYNGYQYAALSIPLLFLINMKQYSLEVFTFTIILLTVSYLLKMKTVKLNTLQSDYNELRDKSSSYSQLMEEKNRSILKNQDYEINLATLNERNRISRELHDNIGHMLSRSLLQVGALLTISKDETVKEGLTSLKGSLSTGMDDIRSSIHQMYDDSVDLYTQIEQLVKNFTFLGISFEYNIKNPPPLVVKHSLIAIVKEALANIMKHSNAKNVIIRLWEHPAMYQLIVQDDGMMEDHKKKEILKELECQDYSEGMGLRNIYDRVKSFDGNINITLDNGFKIFITVPKKKEN